MSHIVAFRYILPALKLRRMLRSFDIYHAIRGANLGESLFALNRLPYLDWVATTISEELRSMGEAWNLMVYRDRMGTGFTDWLRGRSPGGHIVWTVNQVLYPILLLQERWMLRKAVAVHGISRYVSSQIQSAYGVDGCKVGMIHLPVDLEIFSPGSASPRFGGTRYFLFVGRMDDPRKNLGLLLEGFAIIQRQIPNLLLVLVGPIEDPARLERKTRELGIEAAVRPLGGVPLSELVQLYRGAEGVVLSSHQEGFGMVLCEAMACGTPVVSTRCGGPEEIILHGETGFLVPLDNARALADAMRILWEDKGLRAQMGKRAREEVSERFSSDTIGTQILAAYQRLYPHLFGG
jgi:glycosyltransferase involved in cell wall biosynthesis